MSSIKNKINLYRINAVQHKSLKMYLNKLDLHNKLMLILNKKIEKFPYNKISDKLGSSLNQNIIFNFSNKIYNIDRRLININNNLKIIKSVVRVPFINNILLFNKNNNYGKNAIKLLRVNNSELNFLKINNNNRLGIITNVVNIITSLFTSMSCLINRPQLIHKTDKLIVRIFFYQNNIHIFFNNKTNFIYNLFNGSDATKAQYNIPKNKDFAGIFQNMLSQTKWKKAAQVIFKNNEFINTLALANISKKIFILFIKDLINLTTYNKQLTIEQALIRLQKGLPINYFVLSNKTRFLNNSSGLKKKTNDLIKFKKHNQLLMKLINSTNSEYLNKKRTILSKIYFNKWLLSNLIKKINTHNNVENIITKLNLNSQNNIISSKELVGKGLILKPINKQKLDTLITLPNIEISDDYKTIATTLLLLLNINKVGNSSKLSNFELSKKINKNLLLLSNEFLNELRNKINFITKILLSKIWFYRRRTEIIHSNNLNNFPSEAQDYNLIKLIKFEDYVIDNLNKNYLIKIINLINKNFENSFFFHKRNYNKILISIKEALMAYNHNNTPTEILNNLNNINRFKSLGILLTKIFKKNVDIQLIKLHNVGLDTEILAKIIALNAKETKTSTLLKKVWKKVIISKSSLIHFKKQNNIINDNLSAYNIKTNDLIIPVFSKLNNKKEIGVKKINLISNIKKNIKLVQLQDKIKSIKLLNSNPLIIGKNIGLSIKIAGRLAKDPIKPKQTIKKISVGNFSKKHSNAISLSSFTSKNRKGTFRITIKMSHIRTFLTCASKQFNKF